MDEAGAEGEEAEGVKDRLSDPEFQCDLPHMRRVMTEVRRNGGCPNCLHRTAAGKCSTEGRVFLVCLGRGEPSFELDESTIEGVA